MRSHLRKNRKGDLGSCKRIKNIKPLNFKNRIVLGERKMSDVKNETVAEQISLFDDPVEKEKKEQAERQALEQEKQMQKTIIGIKKRFGKNAILKGMNFQEGATARERNEQVGGHKA